MSLGHRARSGGQLEPLLPAPCRAVPKCCWAVLCQSIAAPRRAVPCRTTIYRSCMYATATAQMAPSHLGTISSGGSNDVLCTGSADGTARLWVLPRNTNSAAAAGDADAHTPQPPPPPAASSASSSRLQPLPSAVGCVGASRMVRPRGPTRSILLDHWTQRPEVEAEAAAAAAAEGQEPPAPPQLYRYVRRN